jgi:hypothetical protein
LVIDAAEFSAEDAAKLLVDLVRREKISTLNVAGPRQSEWPEGYDYALHTFDVLLSTIARSS